MGGIVSRWNTSKAQLQPNEDVKEEDPVLTLTLGFAWVTLATNDSYSLGALVLAHSLRNVKTVHKLAVLITPAVSPSMREQLSTVYDLVKVVDVLDSKDEAHLALMKRPELGITFTKIHCWRLAEFEKCVFLDADTLVIKNCDELFDREELSAAPDVGWPDCFNTGVFVFKPSVDTFNNLIKFSMEQGSFDGGDQGLLNQYFGDWATKDIKKHLPFVYNLTSVAVYSYIPAFKQYGSDVRIVHFIGSGKPWLQQLDPSTRTINPAPGAEHLAPLLQMWWDIFCEKVHPSMSTNLECASGMSNDEVEACANKISLETEPAEFIQPFTYYVDKDDSWQINLPYHPFDVESSSGELLNITYLEQWQRNILEEKNYEREGALEVNEGKQSYLREEPHEIKEEAKEVYNSGDNECKKLEIKEKVIVTDFNIERRTEMESSAAQQILEQYRKEEEEVGDVQQVEESQFNYDKFFPDEICVQNYLEKNLFTYKTQVIEGKNADVALTLERSPPLPRFLTLAEDDKRQSLNVCFGEPPPSPQLISIQNTLSIDCPPSENVVNEKIVRSHSEEDLQARKTIPELQTAKLMPSLEVGLPPNKPVEEIAFWKSQSTFTGDQNKKYSMPKLKPLLPKQNVSYVTVNEARPKVTQYTEFHMSYDFRSYVPCDKLGFVERQILEEVKINDMNNDMKLKTLSYIFPQGKNNNKENKLGSVPPDSFDEMTDCDLSLCQRQRGNQPLTNVTNKNNSRANICSLPVLKPLKSSKEVSTCRRMSSNGAKSKDRGTKAKIESRKERENAKTEIKPNAQSNNIEDVLKRLRNFSKGYQKYFTGLTAGKQRSDVVGVIRNGYITSSESPRLQYSKEFEENTDTPFEKMFLSGVSPLRNGECSVIHNGDHFALDGVSVTATSPVSKFITAKDVETREEIVEEVIVPESENLKLNEKPVTSTFENGCGVERLGAKREDVLRKQRVTRCRKSKLNGESECGRLVTCLQGSSSTESSTVKQNEKTFKTVPTRSKPARKSKKRQKCGAVAKKDGDIPGTSAPPQPAAKEPTAKSFNVSMLVPEDSSGDVTANTRRPRSKSSLPGKTFSQPVRKKSEGIPNVRAATNIDDSGAYNSGIAGAIAKLSLQPGGLPGTENEAASSAQEDYIRRQNWEMGTMDYMGRDSFNNIWSKICETLDEKVTQVLGLDGESKNKNNSPPEEIKSDNSKPEQSHLDETPEKMTVEDRRSEDAPPRSDETPVGIDFKSDSKTESVEIDTNVPSKASQALEAFGKLFVSGPVVIKSEESGDVSKPNDVNKSEPVDEKKGQTRSEEASVCKESIEFDTEGKKKTSVLGKILELVGVEPSKTPTSVFYDTEDSKAKLDNMGNSVFYDIDDGQGSPTNLNIAEEVSDQLRKRAASPSLQLKTPGTEIVPPTPPSTPYSDSIVSKDEKLLVADETIMETPPVTDKILLREIRDRGVMMSEVENIIATAVQCAEEQLNRPMQERISSQAEEFSRSLPKANEALEAFGKLFVSGPVMIKSEVAEDLPESQEIIADESKTKEKVLEASIKEEGNIKDLVREVSPAEVAQDGFSKATEITPETISRSADAKLDIFTEKTKDVEMRPTTHPDISSKSVETPQEVVKSDLSSTEAVLAPSEVSTGTLAEYIQKPPEVPAKLAETIQEVPQIPAETDKSSLSAETSVALPESSPDTTTKYAEEPPVVFAKCEGKTQEMSKMPAETEASGEAPGSTEGERRAILEAQDLSPNLVPHDCSEICLAETVVPEECPKGKEKESDHSPSLLSRTNEALEVFGKVFTSGPVVLKSEISENVTESAKSEGKSCSPPRDLLPIEPSQVFGNVFVSGPVTIKSEMTEPDAVHPVLQAKPEDEPIYCNIDELEEIKVTSEEDRTKEKPQSSKLTEQILKAIPPQERKPFTEGASVSSEVSQLLASIEPQNVSILLDKPMTDEMVTAEGDSSPVPPVPPRRNRSKGRDAPLPPPKKKGKNGKS